MDLFSEEEKAEHSKCKSGIESITNFDELIDMKTQKLIEVLRATDCWEVEEVKDDPLKKYSILTTLCTGSKRRGGGFICKLPLKGYILAFDIELQEFLEKYNNTHSS